MEHVDDAEAIRLTHEGDSRGLEILVTRYQMDVYSTALRTLGNPAHAVEASQDAFRRAVSRLDQDRPGPGSAGMPVGVAPAPPLS